MKQLIFLAVALMLSFSSSGQESNVKHSADSLLVSGVWKPEKFWKKSSDQVLKLQVINEATTETNVFFQVAFFHEGKRVESAQIMLKVASGKKAKGRKNGLVLKPDYTLFTFSDGQDYPPNWEVEDLVNQR